MKWDDGWRIRIAIRTASFRDWDIRVSEWHRLGFGKNGMVSGVWDHGIDRLIGCERVNIWL